MFNCIPVYELSFGGLLGRRKRCRLCEARLPHGRNMRFVQGSEMEVAKAWASFSGSSLMPARAIIFTVVEV